MAGGRVEKAAWRHVEIGEMQTAKTRWKVELRGTITRDIKWVEIEAFSMGDAMVRAVALHPTYRAKSAAEV